MRPLAIELFAGSFGWGRGLVAEGWRSVGVDISHEPYHGPVPEHCELVLQDVRTLHGSQFRNASLIVASPPCQEFSYMAMPFSRGRQIAAALRGEKRCDIYGVHDIPVPFPDGYTGSRTRAELTALFDACFRIQREACEAAGRYIPMVVENVKGAQPWVGKSKAHFGSQYLWGDVGMVNGRVTAGKALFGNVLCCIPPKKQQTDASWFYDNYRESARRWSSKSKERKAWTAQVSKIPIELARFIAQCYYPNGVMLDETRNNVVGMASENDFRVI